MRVMDMHQVIVEYEVTGAQVLVLISQLEPVPEQEATIIIPVDNILCVSDEAWAKAKRKFDIIKPIIADRGNKQLTAQVAELHQINVATVYRWVHSYEQTNSVHALVELPKNGGKGKTRIDPELNQVIQEIITDEYLTTQKCNVKHVINLLHIKCTEKGLIPPADSTVRRRIKNISPEEKVRKRWSRKMAKEQFEPHRGPFPGADFPLAIVQIDHTPVDIILVDEVYRQPLERPFLTLAIDTFSRMVVGFYLSFDPVGAVAVGMCMAQAILPKETWLSSINVQGDWPCWGVPSVLHMDNAKEFRGKMLERACEKYGMRLEYRPVESPNWGGIIERMMKTSMQETHSLPGTTFSNVQDRKEYSSESKAAFTLKEFEQWFTTFLLKVYHKRVHKALNTSPFERYREGIFGAPGQLGTGLPAILYDELQVRLDFLPGEERTVQEYGVVIDHIYYYGDVLRPYINALEENYGKSQARRKFVFRRDPRDISHLYFLDPINNQYHRIPYRNRNYPAVSIWEYRQGLAKAKLKGKENVNSDEIFKAIAEMKQMGVAAVERTRKMNKTTHRMFKAKPTEISSLLPVHERATHTSQEASSSVNPGTSTKFEYTQEEGFVILPYDDIYDSALD
jgi:putative transposase